MMWLTGMFFVYWTCMTNVAQPLQIPTTPILLPSVLCHVTETLHYSHDHMKHIIHHIIQVDIISIAFYKIISLTSIFGGEIW